ncbi:MAG TPA: choice-of-anchor Q domain-containing protein [Solirubrobacteraceae bacterium]|nr:choice-of-anchor Q domain-containing protein [Solirubrobacteraceae bacterium]
MAAALIALAVPNVASAQTIPGFLNVDTTKDGNDGECTRDCTLREAVALSNGSQPVLLPAGVYKLTQGPLATPAQQTIIYGAGLGSQQSSGARTTIIDGNNAGRVVQIPSGGNVTLVGVTLTGGRAATGAGAFVASGGTLFLYNSIVRENVATSRGGGLQAAGTLEVIQSTVADNRASVGGGAAIESTGVFYVVESTVSDNTATGGGGAVAAAGPYQFHNATISGGFLGEPGSSGGAFATNTIFAGPGAACGGNVASTPHTSWSGNLASDSSCGLAPAEGTVADPRLGPLRNNRGATDTRALQEGSPAINTGDANFCVGSDQRGAAAVNTCDKGAFEFGGQVPEAQLPPPTPGETVNASRSRGTVRVKLPGSDEFFVLQDGQQLPMGTTFDTTKGRVNLVSAASNVPGPTQKAWFYEGVFKVRQSKGRKPLTTVSMTGKLQCGGKKANAAAAKKKKRRLWGNGKGRFRTKGKHSAATVVGTIWYVEDRCNGTLTRVKRGKVRVTQFKPRKTVVIKGPRGKYFAKR